MTTRGWAPKWADPGTQLTDRDGCQIGTVWSAGPAAGTRWVIDGEEYRAVKVTISGRWQGEVLTVARLDRAAQRELLALAELYARSLLWTGETHWHVDRACAGMTGRPDRHARSGWGVVRSAMRAGQDQGESGLRKLQQLRDDACPKCVVARIRETVAA